MKLYNANILIIWHFHFWPGCFNWCSLIVVQTWSVLYIYIPYSIAYTESGAIISWTRSVRTLAVLFTVFRYVRSNLHQTGWRWQGTKVENNVSVLYKNETWICINSSVMFHSKAWLDSVESTQKKFIIFVVS